MYTGGRLLLFVLFALLAWSAAGLMGFHLNGFPLLFVALVLSGAFTQDHVFLWPFLGDAGAQSLLPAWWVVVVEELLGLVECWWIVGQFDLYLPDRRRDFWPARRPREGSP